MRVCAFVNDSSTTDSLAPSLACVRGLAQLVKKAEGNFEAMLSMNEVQLSKVRLLDCFFFFQRPRFHTLPSLALLFSPDTR